MLIATFGILAVVYGDARNPDVPPADHRHAPEQIPAFTVFLLSAMQALQPDGVQSMPDWPLYWIPNTTDSCKRLPQTLTRLMLALKRGRLMPLSGLTFIHFTSNSLPNPTQANAFAEAFSANQINGATTSGGSSIPASIVHWFADQPVLMVQWQDWFAKPKPSPLPSPKGGASPNKCPYWLCDSFTCSGSGGFGHRPCYVTSSSLQADVGLWACLHHFGQDKFTSQRLDGVNSVLPDDYATTLCILFSKLGALGVSVFSPSGDDGVGEGKCEAKDGSGRAQFVLEWPSSCVSPHRHAFPGPYVTSVGGTRQKHPEVAADLSGGGFSNNFRRPPYQEVAVTTFLEHLGNQYEDFYKYFSLLRPTPAAAYDISAQAINYFIFKGEFVNGTSCAVPTVAGIITDTLLNDYLLSIRKPLRFLNPWLYGEGREGLNDVASGSNPGCGTEGFTAIA
ncbi:peptidase S8/S53 domain-containing protein [Lactarius quietus]|nr:peptidase S8/S53 domain-containing protein [Lactarius quietus]